MVDPLEVFTLDNPQGQYPVFFPSASHTAAGMMSAADKIKLDLLAPGGSGYATVQVAGVALPQQPILNFIGAGISGADDIPGTRTNLTIAPTLQNVYSNGTGPGPQAIALDTTRKGVVIDGAALSISTNPLTALSGFRTGLTDPNTADNVKVAFDSLGQLDGYFWTSVGKIIRLSGGADDGLGSANVWDNGFVVAPPPTAAAALFPSGNLILRGADGGWPGATAGGVILIGGLPGVGGGTADVVMGLAQSGWLAGGLVNIDFTNPYIRSGLGGGTSGPLLFAGNNPIVLQTAKATPTIFQLDNTGTGGLSLFHGGNEVMAAAQNGYDFTSYVWPPLNNRNFYINTSVDRTAEVDVFPLFRVATGGIERLSVGHQAYLSCKISGYKDGAGNIGPLWLFNPPGTADKVVAMNLDISANGGHLWVVQAGNFGGSNLYQVYDVNAAKAAFTANMTTALVTIGDVGMTTGIYTFQNLAAANESVTIGAAGAAAAPPATPQAYLTVLDHSGNTRKIPLYLP